MPIGIVRMNGADRRIGRLVTLTSQLIGELTMHVPSRITYIKVSHYQFLECYSSLTSLRESYMVPNTLASLGLRLKWIPISGGWGSNRSPLILRPPPRRTRLSRGELFLLPGRKKSEYLYLGDRQALRFHPQLQTMKLTVPETSDVTGLIRTGHSIVGNGLYRVPLQLQGGLQWQ